jgi:hypothetical protein
MMFTLIYEKHQSLLSILIYTEDCKHLALPDAPAPSYCTDSVYGLSVRTLHLRVTQRNRKSIVVEIPPISLTLVAPRIAPVAAAKPSNNLRAKCFVAGILPGLPNSPSDPHKEQAGDEEGGHGWEGEPAGQIVLCVVL